MNVNTTEPAASDILRDWRKVALAYWLPIAALLVSGNLNVGAGWRTAVWMVACLTMGGACLLNAFRCGRTHCLFTGPFFIAMSIITLFYGLGLLPLGNGGWNAIGLMLLIGGAALTYGPELVLGKYRKHV